MYIDQIISVNIGTIYDISSANKEISQTVKCNKPFLRDLHTVCPHTARSARTKTDNNLFHCLMELSEVLKIVLLRRKRLESEILLNKKKDSLLRCLRAVYFLMLTYDLHTQLRNFSSFEAILDTVISY